MASLGIYPDVGSHLFGSTPGLLFADARTVLACAEAKFEIGCGRKHTRHGGFMQINLELPGRQ